MIRTFLTAAAPALAVALAALPIAPAGADTQPYYAAVPAAQPAKTSFVTRTAMWRLSNGALVAGRAPERDMVMCQLVAQRAGELQSFAVAGQPFDDAQLAQCNGRVKHTAASTTTVAR